MKTKLGNKPKVIRNRILKIPMASKQKDKNGTYQMLDTKESKKCIKKEKSINIEKIFIKK